MLNVMKMICCCVTIMSFQACSKDDDQKGDSTVVQVYLAYEKTRGLAGGVSDELKICYPTPSEDVPGDNGCEVVTERQADQIAAIIWEASVFNWRSMPEPEIEDLFSYELRIELNGHEHHVQVFGMPDNPERAEAMERFVARVREALSSD